MIWRQIMDGYCDGKADTVVPRWIASFIYSPTSHRSSYILYPLLALSHLWSSKPLTLSSIRLPPMIAWKRLALSSRSINKNVDSPAASTDRCGTYGVSDVEIEGKGMIMGILREASMTCAAKGLMPARRRKPSHYHPSAWKKDCRERLTVVSIAKSLISPISFPLCGRPYFAISSTTVLASVCSPPRMYCTTTSASS